MTAYEDYHQTITLLSIPKVIDCGHLTGETTLQWTPTLCFAECKYHCYQWWTTIHFSNLLGRVHV